MHHVFALVFVSGSHHTMMSNTCCCFAGLSLVEVIAGDLEEGPALSLSLRLQAFVADARTAFRLLVLVVLVCFGWWADNISDMSDESSDTTEFSPGCYLAFIHIEVTIFRFYILTTTTWQKLDIPNIPVSILCQQFLLLLLLADRFNYLSILPH